MKTKKRRSTQFKGVIIEARDTSPEFYQPGQDSVSAEFVIKSTGPFPPELIDTLANGREVTITLGPRLKPLASKLRSVAMRLGAKIKERRPKYA